MGDGAVVRQGGFAMQLGHELRIVALVAALLAGLALRHPDPLALAGSVIFGPIL